MDKPFICAYCGKPGMKYSGHVNRSNRIGAGIYCDKVCAGLGRRDTRTIAEKKAAKAAYDVQYRQDNLDKLKAEKQARHKRTYDPIKAVEHRKTRMPAHIEYCRRPEYKVWKRGYDRKYRTTKQYGDFAECASLLIDIENEIISQMSPQQKAAAHFAEGRTNKTQNRRREHERLNRFELEDGPLGDA